MMIPGEKTHAAGAVAKRRLSIALSRGKLTASSLLIVDQRAHVLTCVKVRERNLN